MSRTRRWYLSWDLGDKKEALSNNNLTMNVGAVSPGTAFGTMLHPSIEYTIRHKSVRWGLMRPAYDPSRGPT